MSRKLSLIGVTSVSACSCAMRDSRESLPGVSMTMKLQVANSRNTRLRRARSSVSASARVAARERSTLRCCGMASAVPRSSA